MAKHWKRDKVMPGLSIYYTLYLLFYGPRLLLRILIHYLTFLWNCIIYRHIHLSVWYYVIMVWEDFSNLRSYCCKNKSQIATTSGDFDTSVSLRKEWKDYMQVNAIIIYRFFFFTYWQKVTFNLTKGVARNYICVLW